MRDLKSEQGYTIGVKPRGPCVAGEIAFASFVTPQRKFKQLSGCFIATAAYGSPLAREVSTLRRISDEAARQSVLAAVGIALYERSSPPLAGLLAKNRDARLLVRRALGPVLGVLRPWSAPSRPED